MNLASDAPFVTLEIAGPGVDPAGVTRRLRLEPTGSSDPPLAAAAARQASPSWGFWVLHTRGQVSGNRLADHLRWLADRIGGGAPALRQLAPGGQARVLALGAPERWERDATADEYERERLGLPLSFVVFVKGDSQIKVGHVEFRDPGGAA